MSEQQSAEKRARPPTLGAPATGPEVPREASSTGAGEAGPRLPLIPGYEVLEFLGEGGMGRVYKARQVHANRIVALKMIKTAGQLGDEQLLARFRTEARLAATL
jgi:serine/threonine-protein kinase